MRGHTKLRAFELADGLALAVYDCTRRFPSDERFAMTPLRLAVPPLLLRAPVEEGPQFGHHGVKTRVLRRLQHPAAVVSATA